MVYMNNLAGQIIIQLYLTLGQISMMLDRRRTDSLVGYVVEILNEITIVLLSYTMMGYGVFVGQGQIMNTIGKVNIAILFICIGLNAIVLIVSSLRHLYRWLRYKFRQKKCVIWLKDKWN